MNDIFETYSIPATTGAICKLHDLDDTLVGTPDYLGLAIFWHERYKQYLRVATPRQRKTVHDRLLAAGLKLDGKSDKHTEIVERVLLKKLKKVYGLS